MREVTAIEPKWLTEVAPSFFKIADTNTISRRKKNEKSKYCTFSCSATLHAALDRSLAEFWLWRRLRSSLGQRLTSLAPPCSPTSLRSLRTKPGRVATLQTQARLAFVADFLDQSTPSFAHIFVLIVCFVSACKRTSFVHVSGRSVRRVRLVEWRQIWDATRRAKSFRTQTTVGDEAALSHDAQDQME